MIHNKRTKKNEGTHRIYAGLDEDKIHSVLDDLIGYHMMGANTHIAEVTYFLNQFHIDTQEDAITLDEELGTKVPIIVVVAHGKNVTEKIQKLLDGLRGTDEGGSD